MQTPFPPLKTPITLPKNPISLPADLYFSSQNPYFSSANPYFSSQNPYFSSCKPIFLFPKTLFLFLQTRISLPKNPISLPAPYVRLGSRSQDPNFSAGMISLMYRNQVPTTNKSYYIRYLCKKFIKVKIYFQNLVGTYWYNFHKFGNSDLRRHFTWSVLVFSFKLRSMLKNVENQIINIKFQL